MPRQRHFLGAVGAVIVLFGAASALAGEHRVAPVADPVVIKECGACHMAFAPAFLPARSWERVMNGLADHFGDDVTLPPDKAVLIRDYLVRRAGNGKFVRRIDAESPPIRITETPYFRHEHDFPARVWQAPGVVTRSNCAACHPGAAAGSYDDD